jgi:flagellar biosynthetic protein FlhB
MNGGSMKKDIRMTKQEVKDEYKLTEGNPEIKSAIHARQQRMAGMRMIQKCHRQML